MRLGKKDLKATGSVAQSKVGRELASGEWSMAFWGRGTVMGPSMMPGVPGNVDSQTALALRALSLVNEVGLGLRVDPQRRLDGPSVVEARPRGRSREPDRAPGCAGHDRGRDGDRRAEDPDGQGDERRPHLPTRHRPASLINSKEPFLMSLGHDTRSPRNGARRECMGGAGL